MAEVQAEGVRSIICLLHDDQLHLYKALGKPLPAYYEDNGLSVAHIPVKDHMTPAMSPADLDKVWSAYQTLPKPVLIHCSAGIDRTGAAVRDIQKRLSAASG